MSEQLKSQEEFLANFNWHNFEEGIDAVDEKNLLEFEELVSKTFIATDQEEVVEGVVVRSAGLFHSDDFSKNVMKFVRKDHVQTDTHWQRNWKKAKKED